MTARPYRAVRRLVRRHPRAVVLVAGLREVVYALRCVTTWCGYVGRGPKANRPAGMVNRVGFALDDALYEVGAELWAAVELDDQEYARWEVA